MGEMTTADIVLVEDDPGHALLIEKNLRRAGLANKIILLRDGREAMDFLFPAVVAVDASPVLVLLDLNLPVLDGYEVLKRLKHDVRTSRIPVVILTTTDNPQEVARCYGLGCNVYVTKPVDYAQFSETINKLGMFLSIFRVPGAGGHHG